MEVNKMKKLSMLLVLLLLVFGMAASAMAGTTYGNNFTMLKSLGGMQGGTNDIAFTWDGIVHSTYTGVSNASLSSNEPFSDWLWYTAGVEVVGPGTWSVDLYAPPDVGGTPNTVDYEATIPAGMIGAHMLFHWGATNQGTTACCKANCNIDVWLAWDANKAFWPAQPRDCFVNSTCKGMWAAEDNGTSYTPPELVADENTPCHTPVPLSILDGASNHFDKVWSLASVDLAGRTKDAAGTTMRNYPLDNVPGMPMADGGFRGFNANFNWMRPCTINPAACDDNNPCTDDSVDLTGCKCVHTPVADGTTCNDWNACTLNDVCTSGICSGTPKSCDDGNVCTTDYCNVATGVCYHQNNIAACDDGNACTIDDKCSNKVCQPGTPKICNDNNICTTDTCNTATGCVFTNNTVSCDDGNICTSNDKCSNGVCKGTNNTASCNDNNACTSNDKCSSGTCKGTNNTVSCNDNNVCTSNDKCSSGVCKGTNNTVSCNDNNACTTNDKCSSGTCKGTAKVCNDNNICTNDSCNTATGACVFANNTVACSDNNACTQNDTCSGGVCVPGTPLVCNDNNSCTAPDDCIPSTGCVFSPVANGTACTEISGGTCQSGVCKIVGIDLTPTAVTAVKSGTTKVVVSDTVKNQGTVSAGKFTIMYYLSTDMTYGTGDIALASASNGTGTCSRTVNSLSSGLTSTSSNKSCYKPSGVSAGVSYYVIVVDDSGNTVSESNETNNTMATSNKISW